MARVLKITLLAVLVAAVGVGAFFVGRQTATTTTSTPPVCRLAQLQIQQSGSSGAAGTLQRTFSLTNTSTTTCTLDGYPGVQLVGRGGGLKPTNALRGGGLAFEEIAPSTVTLRPNQVAYFNAGYSDVMAPCSLAGAVQVTPPGASTHAVVNVSPMMRVCDNGTLHVSAVFAASDTFATRTTAP